MSLVTIASQLKTIADTLSSDILGSSFKYMETKPTDFPALMITDVDSPAEEFYDSNNNLYTKVFLLRAVFAEEESEGAYEKWMTFVDALEDALRTKTNSTFGGTALKVRTVGSSKAWSDTDFIKPVVYYDIQVEIIMLKSIT